MSVEDCRVLEFPIFSDGRGRLSFVEGLIHVPFEIKRLYYLYDIPEDSVRGRHGHKHLMQVIIAISGQFLVKLDDGRNKREVLLNRASQGLYIGPMMWREIKDFSSGAVCLVLASEFYSEADYFRNYQSFQDALK